jgi:hypothetical protein
MTITAFLNLAIPVLFFAFAYVVGRRQLSRFYRMSGNNKSALIKYVAGSVVIAVLAVFIYDRYLKPFAEHFPK